MVGIPVIIVTSWHLFDRRKLGPFTLIFPLLLTSGEPLLTPLLLLSVVLGNEGKDLEALRQRALELRSLEAEVKAQETEPKALETEGQSLESGAVAKS